MNCPCGTNQDYANCCGPLIDGKKEAQTAEAMMRARYTAHVNHKMKFIKETLIEDQRADYDEQAASEWSKKSKWIGLEILKTKSGGPTDTKGEVEFVAKYSLDQKTFEHHEVSQFKKEKGKWLFVSGESHTHEEGQGHHHDHTPQVPVKREGPKVSRNDPCPCGSGKKYKKCCAA